MTRERFTDLATRAITNPRDYMATYSSDEDLVKEALGLGALFRGVRAIGGKILKPGVVKRFAGHHAINSGLYAAFAENPENKGIISRFGSAAINPWVIASSVGTTAVLPRVSRFIGTRGEKMFLNNANKKGLWAGLKRGTGRHLLVTSPEAATRHALAVQKAGGKAGILRETFGRTGATSADIASNLKDINKVYSKSNMLKARSGLIGDAEKQLAKVVKGSDEAVSLNAQIKSLKGMSTSQHNLAGNKDVMTRMYKDNKLLQGLDPAAIKTRGFASELLSPFSPNSAVVMAGASPLALLADIPLIGPAADTYTHMWEPGKIQENMKKITDATSGVKRFDYSKLGMEAGSYGKRRMGALRGLRRV